MRTEANQFRLADLSVFENYVDASVDPDTPPSPLAMAEYELDNKEASHSVTIGEAVAETMRT